MMRQILLTLFAGTLFIGCRPKGLNSEPSHCFKSPATDDQTFYVMDWSFKFLPATKDNPAQNWFVFQYTPDSDHPCENPTEMEVCDRDVTSATDLSTNCIYPQGSANEHEITKIVVRNGSIRPRKLTHTDCTCP